MYLEKIRKMKMRITIAIVAAVAIASSIYVISVYDIKPEIFTAIATIALVIVTIFLVWANLQLVNITKNQDRPYLHFYAKRNGSIYIKNVGKGVALNVEYMYIKNGRPEGTIRTWDALSPKEKFPLDIRYPVLDNEGFLFSWDEIPGSADARLIEFLKQRFYIDWVKTAKIEKIDDGKTIKISTDKNYLSLTLDDEKTHVTFNGEKTYIQYVNLIIDDGRPNILIIAEMENGKLNIYEGNYMTLMIDAKCNDINNEPFTRSSITPYAKG